MANTNAKAIEALILALPESAGSAIYGLIDVFASTGTLWLALVGDEPSGRQIQPKIVSLTHDPFRCGNAIPVTPDLTIGEASGADIIVIPELWLAPDDDLKDRYSELKEWLRSRHRAGSTIYSACSGAVLLAASGLLNGKAATSHWGYADLFRNSFPDVRFIPEPNIVFADDGGRIVTAGGATAWHDLAIHIISRHCSPGEALHIAKVYLLQWHGAGQLPFASLVRRQTHADSIVRRAEDRLRAHYHEPQAVAGVVAECGIPERSLKRRFAAATGSTVIGYVQNLRIEEAKRLLETSDMSVDDIAAVVGYENPAFFRKLFKRRAGLMPKDYRRMFRPIYDAARVKGFGRRP
ncbi:helix-turn-helix domain-containing protein [Rhodoblastus acidophilus]|uniref:Helix-turn-helix domain-containing protein n=1 Tax=Candidatus Rhodoblastus alkanivorans TaxID=2954117 RepID=A0ABS9ZEQ5_9HYPH|nr:helix-turn-helix domain-containing protein [Candidatus Rhodoblastus alkanivorans]MCI4680039.1 helix-turn-helix domain-containing protein [Candidatus Rhodoblastus alkanivorans]MCI4684787.1 helix-turn-helix domain-containing protein [Candidatus Rhodoblastus alkanivorans]MDI4642111.1 helix-turn-helix domain-containing protein [Rhodoblastus acidophilus]